MNLITSDAILLKKNQTIDLMEVKGVCIQLII